jgi:hypothetical protein
MNSRTLICRASPENKPRSDSRALMPAAASRYAQASLPCALPAASSSATFALDAMNA